MGGKIIFFFCEISVIKKKNRKNSSAKFKVQRALADKMKAEKDEAVNKISEKDEEIRQIKRQLDEERMEARAIVVKKDAEIRLLSEKLEMAIDFTQFVVKTAYKDDNKAAEMLENQLADALAKLEKPSDELQNDKI